MPWSGHSNIITRSVPSAGKENARDWGVTKRGKELDESFISDLR
jgi:hypothetical protein